jgi:hypothetical protein
MKTGAGVYLVGWYPLDHVITIARATRHREAWRGKIPRSRNDTRQTLNPPGQARL